MRNSTWDPIVGLEMSVDRRFRQMEARFAALEARIAQRDKRERDAKTTREFAWLVGLLLATMVTMLGAVGVVTVSILGG